MLTGKFPQLLILGQRISLGKKKKRRKEGSEKKEEALVEENAHRFALHASMRQSFADVMEQ